MMCLFVNQNQLCNVIFWSTVGSYVKNDMKLIYERFVKERDTRVSIVMSLRQLPDSLYLLILSVSDAMFLICLVKKDLLNLNACPVNNRLKNALAWSFSKLISMSLADHHNSSDLCILNQHQHLLSQFLCYQHGILLQYTFV